MNKIYYIDLDREKRNTAGAKAPDDIAELCRRGGYHRISMPLYPRDKSKLIQKIWLLTVCTCNWWRIMHCVEEDSIIIYQHPQYGVRIAEKMIPMVQRKRNCKFVTVVHDLESLRGGIEGVIKNNSRTNKLADSILLRHMDCLICHNEKMKDYLVKMGYAQEKIVCLELFDYLNNVQRVQRVKDQIPSIAIAGNLAAGKCKYIYDICKNGQNRNLTIHLYGNNYDSKTSTKNMIWHGSFSPEELPAHLTGDFGLVWDGTSIKTCAGNTGRYLLYNNPHKTSLYLAADMPVIVWKDAAIADFILKNEVGIVVESLDSLEGRIKDVSHEEYRKLCANACRIGELVREGYYFEKALTEALETLTSKK